MINRKLDKAIFALFVAASFSIGFTAWPQTNSSSPAQAKVYIFVQRTDAHGKYSKSEVFHNAMNDLLAFLKEKNIAIAVDEFGGRNFAESATPKETVFKIARDAKANSVLYVVVDRPVTKWIKITAQCFDMNEKQLWTEEASNGSSMSGGDGLKNTTKKLREKLDPHVGKEGLPVLLAVEPAAAAK